jgi:transcriptional regulator with XRE-family HTH domain
MNIGDKITALRKAKDMSQTDLGKAVGVSREIIGRYERNEVLPSVEVAKKIADALEMSLDYLAGEGSQATVDKQTMKLIHDIEELEPAIKDKLFFLANAVIRDAKTKYPSGGPPDKYFYKRGLRRLLPVMREQFIDFAERVCCDSRQHVF